MKFRKITAALLISVAAALICGCSPADSFVPKGFKLISDDNVGYRLYVPDYWIADLSTGVTTAYVSEKDRSNISFMAFEVDDALIQATVGGSGSGTTAGAGTEAPTGTDAPAESGTEASSESGEGASEVPKITTVEEYWAYYSADFKKTFPDMEYQKEGENMLLSGKTAKRYVYTATVTGVKYQFMQVVMLDAGTVYIFTYTALPDRYEEHLESIEEILGHIHIGA